MGSEVYANGNAIACKAGDGKVIAAFPDTCLSPPSPPAGPVPVPYPDTSFSRDLREGSRCVKVGGKPVAVKDQSFYKTSPLGDEAATQSFGGGVVTHGITGKTYFGAWSMDVKLEGLNVPRHLDISDSPGVAKKAGRPRRARAGRRGGQADPGRGEQRDLASMKRSMPGEEGMSQLHFQRPEFLGEDWLRCTRGYAFAGTPPEWIWDEARLRSPNPWEQLVCIFARATKGERRHLDLLPTLARAEDDHLRDCALRLLGQAASPPLRYAAVSLFEHADSDTRSEAYIAAALSLDLAFVEPMLAARRMRRGFERVHIMSKISSLLEPVPRDLLDDTDTLSDDAYEALARERVETLQARYGAATGIFRGAPLDVTSLVRTLEDMCRAENVLETGGAISSLLDLLEAVTGAKIVGLLDDDCFPRPLDILAFAEDLRETGGLDRYQTGQRYFFGHPIA